MLMTELNLSDLSLKEWPELYGFHIYGDGPTYVVHVEPNSISDKAGIRVGDMIIELDGCNVSKDSADDVRSIARIAKRKPPPICVQCVTQRVSINNFKYQKKHMNGCGFSVKGDSPVKVEDMDNKSKAHKAGMRSGDIIIDVNNSTVNKEKDFKELLEQSDKNLDIGFLSIQNGSGQGQNELVRLSQWSKSSSKLSQDDMRVEDRTDSIKLPNTDHLLPMPKVRNFIIFFVDNPSLP
jgi:S1-C subfamily serine protease